MALHNIARRIRQGIEFVVDANTAGFLARNFQPKRHILIACVMEVKLCPEW